MAKRPTMSLGHLNTGALPFTVGDAESDPSILTVTTASTNTTLVPLSGIVINDGDGTNRTVTVTPEFLALYSQALRPEDDVARLDRLLWEGEAAAALREGLARNPRAATLHHALGLSLVRQKQTAEGLKALIAAIHPDKDVDGFGYAAALL